MVCLRLMCGVSAGADFAANALPDEGCDAGAGTTGAVAAGVDSATEAGTIGAADTGFETGATGAVAAGVDFTTEAGTTGAADAALVTGEVIVVSGVAGLFFCIGVASTASMETDFGIAALIFDEINCFSF